MAYTIVVTGLVGGGDVLEYEFDTDDQLKAEGECLDIYFCKSSESDPDMKVEAFEIVRGKKAQDPVYRITGAEMDRDV